MSTTPTPSPTLDSPSPSSEAAQACAEPPKAPLTRLNANIKLELHTALKVRAAMEGTTIGALIEEWIASWAHKK